MRSVNVIFLLEGSINSELADSRKEKKTCAER